MATASPKLLYFIANDAYFVSHRLSLALAAQKQGYDVHLMTVVSTHRDAIEQAGITVWPLKHLKRGQSGPFNELRALYEVIKTIRYIKPDIVHDVAMKPVLFGAFAGKFFKVKRHVHALGGLGYIFTSGSPQARFLRTVVSILWRFLLRGPHQIMIVQNQDDYDVCARNGIKNLKLIPGSGVDINTFQPATRMNKIPIILCVARMLYDKGIAELVEASRLLKNQNLSFKIQLCGGTDDQNPSGIPHEQLKQWHDEGVIEWLGHRDDVADLCAKADIAVLPSYREGFPKSLLEAAASGLSIVTTDVPGCRDAIENGRTGLLVPPQSPRELAIALSRYIGDKDLRQKHGLNGRDYVVQNFSIEKIADMILNVYTLDDRS